MQPLADVIKLITKEDLIPPYVNKFLYLAAPFFAITMALLSISVIPFGAADTHLRRQHLDAVGRSEYRHPVRAGVSSVSVYGIALAGGLRTTNIR
jgi:NADH-quinone oxidoreductase subunit H